MADTQKAQTDTAAKEKRDASLGRHAAAIEAAYVLEAVGR
jgi:hypothetical protein